MNGLAYTLSSTTGFNPQLSDRAGLSLFGSILIHLILIFGIRFIVVLEHPAPNLPTLRLTIVNALVEETIKATALAQHNQSGSGTESTSGIATTPLPMTRNPLLFESGVSDTPTTNLEAIQSVKSTTTSDSHLTLLDGKEFAQTEIEVIQNTIKRITTPVIDSPITAEVDTLHQQSRERKRHTFISSNTRESIFAAYMEIWRVKVERIGTLNYPDVAKRLNANETIVLDVAIRRDGSLQETRLVKSSGNKHLDDAAIRIAQLAAPFDPLPVEIARHSDILHITRTWQFHNDAQLITR